MDKCPITGSPCPHIKCIHVTEVTNYQATEAKDMCTNCGLAYISDKGGPKYDSTAEQVFQMIGSILKNAVQDKPCGVIQPKKQIGCPTCGSTPEEILMTGKIGCGNCYEYYKKELAVLIEKCQSGATKHMGKVPKQFNPELTKKLEADLKVAIEKENYEQAAKLRDEIKKLGQ